MSILPLCCMLAGFFPQPASAAKTIQLAIGEYEPYYSKRTPHLGKVPEITTSVFAKQNINIQYSWLAWERAYEHVKNGRYDGSFTSVKNPEKLHDFYFSDPIINSKIMFFHLKELPFTWECLEDLQGILVGGTLGHPYTADFLKATQNGDVQVDWASNDIINLKKLLNRQIDIFPISKEVGLYQLKEYFSPKELKKITWSPTPLVSNYTHLILSRKNGDNEQLLQLFNENLKSTTPK